MDSQGSCNIVRALQLLASEARRQILLFPPGVAVADEIALLFDDGMLLVEQEQKLNCNNIAEPVLMMLRALDTEFARLSNEPFKSFWTTEALCNDLRWQRFRTTAREILTLMGEPIGPASITGVYVTLPRGSCEDDSKS
jgi:hypothetical protein